jgi:dUTPase
MSLSFYHTGDRFVVDPSRGTTGSVGIDLYQPRDETVAPLETKHINLKLTIRFPPGVFGLLALRSSTSHMNIALKGGVIGEARKKKMI